jgi:exopolysaccharide biosynthesis polyprenyl glycosylphosphotransferase
MASFPIEQWNDTTIDAPDLSSADVGGPVQPPDMTAPLIVSPAWHTWQATAKRALDLTAAFAGLLILSPLMALIALAIRIDSPGPIIFRQTRCGKDGRPFTFLKFRGMVADAEARKGEVEQFNEVDGPIFKMRHDPRVTRVGRILRKTSLDELPQLWNVLRGEMSLVGPRPPIPTEVAQYAMWHRGRLATVGGITGLWQVNGRSELSFDEMVQLDLRYIEQWSIWLDFRILSRTVIAVVTVSGAY